MTMLLPIYIALLVPVFITYKIKNRYLRWGCIILPPFLLVPLILVPLDIGSVGLWVPAMLAMLFSVGSVVVNVAVAVVRKVRKQDAVGRRLAVRLIRPLSVVCIFFCAINTVMLSRKSADIYAVEVGRRIQRACDANGVCPKVVKGWEQSGGGQLAYQILYGKYGTKYPLSYSVSEGGKEFVIRVRHNIDEVFYVTGGVDRDVMAEISVTGYREEIDVNELAPD